MGSSSTQIATKYPVFSSSSSSSSLGSSYLFPDDSPLGPATPFRFSGVPFSWEQLPGIPKKLQQQNHNKKDYSIKLQLPLPPPTSTTTTRRTSKSHSFDDMLTRNKASAEDSNSFRRMDPFYAALVECSKEDDQETGGNDVWTGAKVTRSISDRLGLINNLYTSCKRSCAVSESTVYLPRSRRTADHYGLINHHRRSRQI